MDSEIHYLNYNPDDIWEKMISNYVNAGGDILYPGDEKEMILRSVQMDIVQVLASVDNAFRMRTRRYATGEYLDLVGEAYGCKRIEATAAKGMVTITVNATGRQTLIPAGSLLTNDGDTFYALVNDVYLTGYYQVIDTEIAAVKPGVLGNGLPAGTQLQFSTTYSGVKKVVVKSETSGGNDREDDEAYRERIGEYGMSSSTAGPVKQYEAKSKEVSSEILDVKAINGGPGRVWIYILTYSENANTIVSNVLKALSAENVRPLTDNVSVFLSASIPYKLNVKIESDGSSITSANITKAINDYQNWQDNTIGQAFNPDRLTAALYQAGATLVTYTSGSNFNGGEVKHTVIEQEKHCKGTINITS